MHMGSINDWSLDIDKSESFITYARQICNYDTKLCCSYSAQLFIQVSTPFSGLSDDFWHVAKQGFALLISKTFCQNI